jgi:hypothetical protein
MKVRLDLNSPEFQKEWFSLSKDDFLIFVSLHPDHDSAYD